MALAIDWDERKSSVKNVKPDFRSIRAEDIFIYGAMCSGLEE
ncbi:MAG: hypothetical protein ACM34K_19065 [Bacillota bacterium]